MLFFQRQEQVKDRIFRYRILYISFCLHLLAVLSTFFANTIKKNSNIITIHTNRKNTAKVLFALEKQPVVSYIRKEEIQQNSMAKDVLQKEKIVKSKIKQIKHVVKKEIVIKKNCHEKKSDVIRKINNETILPTDYFQPDIKSQNTKLVHKEERKTKLIETNKELVKDTIKDTVSVEESVLSDKEIYNEIMMHLTLPSAFKKFKPVTFTFEIGFDGKARNIQGNSKDISIIVYTAIKKAILRSNFASRGRIVTLIVK